MKNYSAMLALILALFVSTALIAQDGGQDGIEKNLTGLVEKAYLAQRSGRLDEALALYSSIIQKRGLDSRQRAVTYLLRGEVQKDKGNLDEAARDFTAALKQWEHYPHALFSRGKIYERQDKLIEAYADLSEAADLDPEREMYQSNLAILRKKMAAQGLIMQEPGEAAAPSDVTSRK